ncbi:hypothetical protein BBO99_00006935 [Phytophthora kernoviae]|uniref:Uncharacterized protein n=1 Tax=Phytophthora kernoviae TaxID=325452 RepID=A0A3R7J4Z6_9STRA|nr:hypothetical protein JM16_006471 [Phytophthora kernoviae]RLN13810.1 hypothetical protein BBI17_005338 [Phytophthora kernoviae]RLN77211.1 hypothetical protein BBO99_00006935 [Phytophthora kernoviae]
MSAAAAVVQGLIKIFELREAIRHQRRANKQTYLQLTEIHVELQFLERHGPLHGDATLRRNATLKKFTSAVAKFSAYLEKYNDMKPFFRLFKRGDMETERQEIVSEIDQLFRMLGLATTVTVMNASNAATKNASNLLSKLEDVHKDVKLTHAQVQAALHVIVERRNSLPIEEKVLVTTEKPEEKRGAVLLENFSTPLLMETLNSGCSANKEKTLLLLIRKCVRSSSRVQVYQANGIPILSKLVRESDSFVTQLYALHCLSWFTFIYSKMPESDFEMLRGCIRVATRSELTSLLHDLENENTRKKEDAVILCSCMATNGNEDALRDVGVLAPLIELLQAGTPHQKLWAAEALGTLVSNNDENCVEIVRGGAIKPLVSLLQSGTDMQKQEAAYALGNLAINRDENRVEIARAGAIAPLVSFIRAVTDAQNQWAVYALGVLSLNNEVNRIAIAHEGAILPLVKLVKAGTNAQKQWAAYTLGTLAHNDDNRVEMTLAGVVKPFVTLLQTGTDAQKHWTAYAVGNIACDKDGFAAEELAAAILPLVELVRSGTDSQKQEAAYALGNLAVNNEDNRASIARGGAIAPLVELVRVGTDEQKQWGVYALECLADQDDENRVAIVRDEAIPLLGALGSTDSIERNQAVLVALESLNSGTEADSSYFCL